MYLLDVRVLTVEVCTEVQYGIPYTVSILYYVTVLYTVSLTSIHYILLSSIEI